MIDREWSKEEVIRFWRWFDLWPWHDDLELGISCPGHFSETIYNRVLILYDHGPQGGVVCMSWFGLWFDLWPWYSDLDLDNFVSALPLIWNYTQQTSQILWTETPGGRSNCICIFVTSFDLDLLHSDLELVNLVQAISHKVYKAGFWNFTKMIN